MHPHAQLIKTFYRSLAARDAARMAACYAEEVHFTDEVFDLRGAEAGAMWAMLCERGEDLTIEFRDVEADDLSGRAHWDAAYTFSATGRQVRNSRKSCGLDRRTTNLAAWSKGFAEWWIAKSSFIFIAW